ncbi:hypothetical protein GILI108418_02020 [Gillisia limnaea]|uniref:Uncharacterized protein n=1 Tax=Gillisia limnaea (strain DSM 15749 / LMG 21470 / R-8282) TaxID=865937 RepID=H2BYY5_GILLR|nr:hypothetical protein Gilli_2716 [Gillisia limnaea DSM 15749]
MYKKEYPEFRSNPSKMGVAGVGKLNPLVELNFRTLLVQLFNNHKNQNRDVNN